MVIPCHVHKNDDIAFGYPQNMLIVLFNINLNIPLGPVNRSPCWWFGEEDCDHAEKVVSMYDAWLNLSHKRTKGSREPLKFVGRVKRTLIGEHKLPNCTTNGQGSTEQQRAETEGAEGEGRSQHVVITLDEVLVYRREGLPIGSAMPRVNQEHFITAWDVEDGIPTGHTRLLSQKDVEEWQNRVTADKSPRSFLYCFPVFNTEDDYIFCAGTCEREVCYSGGFSSCISKSMPALYDKYPKRYLPDETEPEPSEEISQLQSCPKDILTSCTDDCGIRENMCRSSSPPQDIPSPKPGLLGQPRTTTMHFSFHMSASNGQSVFMSGRAVHSSSSPTHTQFVPRVPTALIRHTQPPSSELDAWCTPSLSSIRSTPSKAIRVTAEIDDLQFNAEDDDDDDGDRFDEEEEEQEQNTEEEQCAKRERASGGMAKRRFDDNRDAARALLKELDSAPGCLPGYGDPFEDFFMSTPADSSFSDDGDWSSCSPVSSPHDHHLF